MSEHQETQGREKKKDDNKMKLTSTIDAANFKLEVQATVNKDDLEHTISFIVSAFEKNYKKIEKTFGSVSVKPVIEQAAKAEYPFKELNEAMTNIARKLNAPQEKITGNNLFGFKGDKPQIFDTARFKSPERATRALLYLFEVGLSKTEVPREELQESYQISKVKGRLLTNSLSNLRKNGHIEKKVLTLTAKGMAEAENELKALLSI